MTTWEDTLTACLENVQSATKMSTNQLVDMRRKTERFSQQMATARGHAQKLRRPDLKLELFLEGALIRGCAKLEVDKTKLDPTQTISPGQVLDYLGQAERAFLDAIDSTDRRICARSDRLSKKCKGDWYKVSATEAMKNLDFKKASDLYSEFEAKFGESPWIEGAKKEVVALKKTEDYHSNLEKWEGGRLRKLASDIGEVYLEAAAEYGKEEGPDKRNINFCLAMENLFGFLASGEEEDWTHWQTRHDALPSDPTESGSRRSQLRGSIFKIAKSMHNMSELKRSGERVEDDLKWELVGVPGRLGLEGRLKKQWRLLCSKVPQARYDGNGRRLVGTLGEMFGVFERHLGTKTPYELSHSYWLFTHGFKHPDKMTQQEYEKELSWAKDLTETGALSKICSDFLLNVQSSLRRLPPEE